MKMSVRELTRLYFDLGLHHFKDTAALLAARHGYVVSERLLKQILRSCTLFRRRGCATLDRVVSFIEEQLQTSGQLWPLRKADKSPSSVILRLARRLLQND